MSSSATRWAVALYDAMSKVTDPLLDRGGGQTPALGLRLPGPSGSPSGGPQGGHRPGAAVGGSTAAAGSVPVAPLRGSSRVCVVSAGDGATCPAPAARRTGAGRPLSPSPEALSPEALSPEALSPD